MSTERGGQAPVATESALRTRSYTRLLCATALAYTVLHHLGLLPSGLGAGPQGSRWADWLDLAVPWLVLVPAALALRTAEPPAHVWFLFGAGVVAYTSGHGIHLAANSVGNAAPGPTAHLWDEVVGHQVWFAGVVLVVAALAVTMSVRPRPPLLGYLLAIGVGMTWASNAVGGGTVVFSLLAALAAAAYGWVRRESLASVLLVGSLPAAAWLGGLLVACAA